MAKNIFLDWIRSFRENKTKKTICIEDRSIIFKFKYYQSSFLEVWCESERVLKILQELPYKNLIPEIFKAYKEESKSKFRYLLITDDEKIDNWYWESKRTWVVTVNGVLSVVRNFLNRKNRSLYLFDQYLADHKIVLEE